MPLKLLEYREPLQVPEKFIDRTRAQELTALIENVTKTTKGAWDYSDEHFDQVVKLFDKRASQEVAALTRQIAKKKFLTISEKDETEKKFTQADIAHIVEQKKKLWAQHFSMDVFGKEEVFTNPKIGDDDLHLAIARSLLGIEQVKLREDLRAYPRALERVPGPETKDTNLAEFDAYWRQQVQKVIGRVEPARYRIGTGEWQLVENFWKNYYDVFGEKEGDRGLDDEEGLADEKREGIMTELAVARFLRDTYGFGVKFPSPAEDADYKIDWLLPTSRQNLALAVQVKGINVSEENQEVLKNLARIIREPGRPETADPKLTNDENKFLRGCKKMEDALDKYTEPGDPRPAVAGLFIYIPKMISTPLWRSQAINFQVGQIEDRRLIKILQDQIRQENKRLKLKI